MMRVFFTLLISLACLELTAQQNASYTYPYQAIPASTVPAANLLPPAGQTPPLPLPAAPGGLSTNDSRALQPSTAEAMGTIIPLKLEGYELRVMNVTKRVTFQVAGQSVEAQVPIFVYMPTQGGASSNPVPAAGASSSTSSELRKLYNDLIGLYNQDSVDKEQVRGMLKRLDSIIDGMNAAR